MAASVSASSAATGISPVAPEGVAQPTVALDGLTPAEVRGMREAAIEVAEGQRVLAKAGLNVVGELLRGHDTFYEDDHYPTGDVFDGETGSQYYYHAHRGIELEHGHFHTFLRGPGLLGAGADVTAAQADSVPGHDDLVHLVGVSMDPWGFPMALFATNQWVTGESWLPAVELDPLLPNFAIDHAWPSWPVNRWITGLLALFRPQLRALLAQRDAVVAQWQQKRPQSNALQDTGLELTGWLAIDPRRQAEELDALYDADGMPRNQQVR